MESQLHGLKLEFDAVFPKVCTPEVNACIVNPVIKLEEGSIQASVDVSFDNNNYHNWLQKKRELLIQLTNQNIDVDMDMSKNNKNDRQVRGFLG